MNKYVHFYKTKKWALEEGFSEEESELIAQAAVQIDRKLWSKPWAHFAFAGAYPAALILLWLSVRFKSLRFLGFSIHAVQDVITHGWIIPWRHNHYEKIDDWQEASEEMKKRIKESTKIFLKKYRKSKLLL